jgi:elongation factor G
VVDLIANKAYVWDDESLGSNFDEGPVPEDMVELVNEYRTKLIEGTAEESEELA